MIWARMLAYITGTVDQELLLRNEYLATENRILRAQTKGRLLLSNSEKATLAEIAHRLGRKALADVASAAKPDTLFRWYRELIAKKFDGSKFRKSLGRPLLDAVKLLPPDGAAQVDPLAPCQGMGLEILERPPTLAGDCICRLP